MKVDKFIPYLISLLVLLLFSIIMASVLTPYGSATSPDSIAYLDIAANFKAGRGLSATNFSLENPEGQAVVHQRSWPPAYQLALSGFIKDFRDVKGAANLSTVLLFTTLAVIFLLLSTQLYWVIALIGSMLISLSLPIVLVYTYAWSEALFIPLLIITVYAAIGYTNGNLGTPLRRFGWMVLMLTGLILMAYTRYIGIAFAVLIPSVFLLSRKDKWDWIMLPSTIITYAMAVGYWLYDNYQLTGSISGTARPPSDKSLIENGLATAYALLTSLPVSLLSYLISLAITAGVVFTLTHYWHKFDNKNHTQMWRPLLLLAISAGIYLLALVALRSHSQFDNIDVRLIAPAIPLILMLLMMTSGFAGSRKVKLLVIGITAFIVISQATRGYSLYYSAMNNLVKHGSQQRSIKVGKLIYNDITPNPSDNPDSKALHTLVDKKGVLIIQRPIIWRFITGIPTIQVPENIELSDLNLMNALPAGSVLVLENHQFNDLQKMVAPNSVHIQARDLGDFAAIGLPINLKNLD